jgi:hypothetical protein
MTHGRRLASSPRNPISPPSRITREVGGSKPPVPIIRKREAILAALESGARATGRRFVPLTAA